MSRRSGNGSAHVGAFLLLPLALLSRDLTDAHRTHARLPGNPGNRGGRQRLVSAGAPGWFARVCSVASLLRRRVLPLGFRRTHASRVVFYQLTGETERLHRGEVKAPAGRRVR